MGLAEVEEREEEERVERNGNNIDDVILVETCVCGFVIYSLILSLEKIKRVA